MGPKADVDNYRSISVLSAVSRVLEKIAHDQVLPKDYLKGTTNCVKSLLVLQNFSTARKSSNIS